MQGCLFLLKQESLNGAQRVFASQRVAVGTQYANEGTASGKLNPKKRKHHESDVDLIFKTRATSELMQSTGQSQKYKMKKQSLRRRLLF